MLSLKDVEEGALAVAHHFATARIGAGRGIGIEIYGTVREVPDDRPKVFVDVAESRTMDPAKRMARLRHMQGQTGGAVGFFVAELMALPNVDSGAPFRQQIVILFTSPGKEWAQVADVMSPAEIGPFRREDDFFLTMGGTMEEILGSPFIPDDPTKGTEH